MCNCRTAKTVVEKYGEQVVNRSDSIIFFSRVLDIIIISIMVVIGLPLLLSYGLIMSATGRKASIKMPRAMARGVKLAMEKNGEAI